METNLEAKFYTIGGVKITFPHKAYPSQITMMDKIIKSLNKKQNCLLESPTGSGKSLALLCASLAWQRKVAIEIAEYEAKLDKGLNSNGAVEVDTPSTKIKDPSKLKKPVAPSLDRFKFQASPSGSSKSTNENSKKRGVVFIDLEEMEDFKENKKFKSPINSLPKSFNSHTANNSGENLESNLNSSNAQIADIQDKKMEENSKSVLKKVPKIYFGTRTHKQIEQIIRELRKTIYKDTKMTILSSRERTCIHPTASISDNKNEACRELVNDKKNPQCFYYKNYRKINHNYTRSLSTAFDLEDFVSVCRSARACPYFASREMLSQAEIVFCPYNYLVDPLIRSNLDINLKGTIIIMDEAHNLEDSARESSSTSLTLSLFEEAKSSLLNVGQYIQSQSYLNIAAILNKIITWLKDHTHDLSDYKTFTSSSKVWAGNNMIALLNCIDLGPDIFKDFQQMVEEILSEENAEEDKEEDPNKPKLSEAAIMCLKTFVVILNYMYKDNMAFISDYRCVIQKTILQPQSKSRNHLYQSVNPYQYELSINFLCMNPAVAISDFKGKIHSLIVSSGTLSPMVSFQSELDIPFEITLEANHVVSSSQMWIGTISKGPNNNLLSAIYQNTETFAFQDEIGNLVKQVCEIIPYGILCFLPSYSMLDKLVNRWKLKGIWEQLLSKKVVICEPKGQKNFANAIDTYYEAIKESQNGYKDGITGALFLAVCRGKVSEGIDFADNNARAVITIGIPFPNFKEADVDLKRKYNDMYAKQRQILTGHQWYEIQAFRALNQALGRCLRHKNDFGALIIVDERFQKNPHYINSLSKWIKKEIFHYYSFSEAVASLEKFVEDCGLVNSHEEVDI